MHTVASTASTAASATTTASLVTSDVANPAANSSWGPNLPPFFDYWGQTKTFDDNGIGKSEPTDQQ